MCQRLFKHFGNNSHFFLYNNSFTDEISVTFYGKIQMNFLTSPILCHAHYSIIYKSQDTETIYISVDG